MGSNCVSAETLIRQIWEDLFLKVTKIVCSFRQELKLWSKNTKLNLSVNVLVSFSNKIHAQRLEIQDTHNTDLLNLDENKFVYKKNIDEERSSPRYSNPKYARNGRNEDRSRTSSWRRLSAKIKRKSSYNAKAHLSRCKKMQEEMNSMNDLVGDCPTFPVSLQWFQVLVPCWAATNACLLTHGIHRDYRKTLLVIHFLRLIHPKIILKEFILAQHKENEGQFLKLQVGQEMTNKWTKCRQGGSGASCASAAQWSLPFWSSLAQLCWSRIDFSFFSDMFAGLRWASENRGSHTFEGSPEDHRCRWTAWLWAVHFGLHEGLLERNVGTKCLGDLQFLAHRWQCTAWLREVHFDVGHLTVSTCFLFCAKM